MINDDVGSLDVQAGFLPAGAIPSQAVGAMSQQFRLLNHHIYLREALTGVLATTDEGEEELDGVRYRVLGFDKSYVDELGISPNAVVCYADLSPTPMFVQHRGCSANVSSSSMS